MSMKERERPRILHRFWLSNLNLLANLRYVDIKLYFNHLLMILIEQFNRILLSLIVDMFAEDHWPCLTRRATFVLSSSSCSMIFWCTQKTKAKTGTYLLPLPLLVSLFNTIFFLDCSEAVLEDTFHLTGTNKHSTVENSNLLVACHFWA